MRSQVSAFKRIQRTLSVPPTYTYHRLPKRHLTTYKRFVS